MSVAIIRVEFQNDVSPATAGDGRFVLAVNTDLDCTEWSLDPPPHDKTYFQDHLIAARNYWQRVSGGLVDIDLVNSDVFPAEATAAYQLPHDMLYYQPYLEDFDETSKLFELSRDALALADPDIDFNAYSTVILVHAGMGGDFAFALDPTPGNIPSAYLGNGDFDAYGVLQTDEKVLDDLIIIPESQNFLQYKETRTLFEDSSDPCFYQVALNGTLALMFGFHLDLPPLYNTETGRSLVGGFALMDQGSNNFHGIAPAFPNPYTRIEKGWVTSTTQSIGDSVRLAVSDDPVRIDLLESEYYLIENRQRDQIAPAGMTVWTDTLGFDTVSVELGVSGAVLSVDEQHAGLPGNGLYIWHIDELARYTDENPNGGTFQLVDFVEADGAQDMGYTTQLLFAELLETGWWFDPWFAGNEGWFHLNRNQDVIGDSLLHFDSNTFPSTRSNSGIQSHLKIENISKNGSVMSFSINSDRLVNNSPVGQVMGWGNSSSSLWAFSSDGTSVIEATYPEGKISSIASSVVTPASIFEDSIDSLLIFRYPWVVTNLVNGTCFRNIDTGDKFNHLAVYNPFEVSVNGDQVTYLAENDTSDVIVYWNSALGQRQTFPIYGTPRSKFTTTSGTQILYGDADLGPEPVAVTHGNDFSSSSLFPDQIDYLQWSNASSHLTINGLPDGVERVLTVDEPDYMIPIDTDDDGVYEISLFYQNTIKIINQAGVLWNGSPFSVEAYYGNPLIGVLGDADISIFLRHADSYSIYTLAGEIIDRGMLPPIDAPIVNSMGIAEGVNLVLSGESLLYFENDDIATQRKYWSDPKGRQQGDRLVVLMGDGPVATPVLDHTSVYNYPNPIKGNSTTIRAWIGDVDSWTIEIFSMNGSQVIFTEQFVTQSNAYNEWVWDASSVSNGVYLAQIVAGGKAEIIKIAIIR